MKLERKYISIYMGGVSYPNLFDKWVERTGKLVNKSVVLHQLCFDVGCNTVQEINASMLVVSIGLIDLHLCIGNVSPHLGLTWYVDNVILNLRCLKVLDFIDILFFFPEGFIYHVYQTPKSC